MLFNDGIDLYRIKGSTGFVKVDQIVAESAYSFVAFNNYDINGRLDGHFISMTFESYCQQKYRHLCPKIIFSNLKSVQNYLSIID